MAKKYVNHEAEDEAEQRPAHHKRSVVDEQSQREAYGGFNFGAAFFGWLVSTGVAAIITAVLAAIGGGFAIAAGSNISKDLTKQASGIGVLSGIAFIVALFIAYYAGGYVAGRMSRFNGAKQGFGVWAIGAVIVILLAVAGAAAGGSHLDALRQASLPTIPVSKSALGIGGLITLAATAILSIVAAVLGGKVGERYHRKVDRAGIK